MDGTGAAAAAAALTQRASAKLAFGVSLQHTGESRWESKLEKFKLQLAAYDASLRVVCVWSVSLTNSRLSVCVMIAESDTPKPRNFSPLR